MTIAELGEALAAAGAQLSYLGLGGRDAQDWSTSAKRAKRKWACAIQATKYTGANRLPRDLILRGFGATAEDAVNDVLSQLGAYLIAHSGEKDTRAED